ncbi:GYDIA family GHMP kinase [Zhouia sp. PK063]|uniref:GYDIA family GHMP kinase n=1 Tax=Zhouia sp. PK063 TaxID=3373602 RepID=UPI003797BC27
MKEFYSNGKLFITGEYAVLDGALIFALPTKFGQSLMVEENESNLLLWRSFDDIQHEWLTITFDVKRQLEIVSTTDERKAKTLQDILLKAKQYNQEFLNNGAKVTTKLTFPRNWGLGTSSTLVNNIANWAQIDAFTLLWNSFGGSGYDIACARNNTAITYQIVDEKPIVQPQNFNPGFLDKLFFIYLNKKQDSKKGIAHYKSLQQDKTTLVSQISKLSVEALNSKRISDFEAVLNEHENIISSYLQLEKVKDIYFNDYWGSVKSLGAWGGDFVMATGNEKSRAYFKNKGFDTILSYKEMILQ